MMDSTAVLPASLSNPTLRGDATFPPRSGSGGDQKSQAATLSVTPSSLAAPSVEVIDCTQDDDDDDDAPETCPKASAATSAEMMSSVEHVSNSSGDGNADKFMGKRSCVLLGEKVAVTSSPLSAKEEQCQSAHPSQQKASSWKRRRAGLGPVVAPSSSLGEGGDFSSHKQRRRVTPDRYTDTRVGNEEIRLFQQAIDNSRSEKMAPDFDPAAIPLAPEFHPTLEEFKDPLAYIESIKALVEPYGIAKIVPPKGWKVPPLNLSNFSHRKFPTRKQAIHRLQEGEAYDDGRDFTLAEYEKMDEDYRADWAHRHYSGRMPIHEDLERDYWRVVQTASEPVFAEYANDLDVSEFFSGFPAPPEDYMEGEKYDKKAPVELGNPDYYSRCGWNLNNLPFWPGSVLRFFRTHIQGVTRPWLYMGQLFSTFAWHNEDNYLYSMNYHHSGAPKQWYGVPGSKAKKFEVTLHKHVRALVDSEPDLLYHITTMISPTLLRAREVPVSRLVQNAGDFVITLPKAYHGGFSYGFNMGEAVNFGTIDWITYGAESNDRYRIYARPSVFSFDRMAFTLSMYLEDHDLHGCQVLLAELQRLRDEELAVRKELLRAGIQDVSAQVKLPQFELRVIGEKAAEYDDQRMCAVCKHTCFMSAVSCRCTKTKVVCPRHWQQLCACKTKNMYFFFWMTLDDINRIVDLTERHVKSLESSPPLNEPAITSSSKDGVKREIAAAYPPERCTEQVSRE